MPARIYLSTGKDIDVSADPHQILEALNSPTGRLVPIPVGDTSVLINPDHVAYIEQGTPRSRVPVSR